MTAKPTEHGSDWVGSLVVPPQLDVPRGTPIPPETLPTERAVHERVELAEVEFLDLRFFHGRTGTRPGSVVQ